jgi:hypothetical protein
MADPETTKPPTRLEVLAAIDEVLDRYGLGVTIRAVPHPDVLRSTYGRLDPIIPLT